MNIKSKTQKQKRPSKPRLRNRYARNAKLSEYKFLKILRGFSEAKPVKELSAESRISERTIRDTYWALRQKLYEAVISDKNLFGGAGQFIFSHGKITHQGTMLMEAVADSEAFAALVLLQFPGNHQAADEQAQLLVFEMAIRALCKSPSIPRKLAQKSEPVVQCYREALAIIKEIERVQNDPVNKWTVGTLKIELEHKLMELDLLKAQHDIGAVTEDHRMSIDPSHMIYSNLRTFLAKRPLDAA